MAEYPKLVEHVPGPHGAQEWSRTVDSLMDIWLGYYGGGELVTTEASGFFYLFDVTAQRLVAAWGVSRGKFTDARDRSRMAGAPLGAAKGSGYHRGHAIPHTLGGPTDINLVPQLGSVNVGDFRKLEREAVATPGSLYFTHWVYSDGASASASQRPISVFQGLLVPGRHPRITHHGN